MSDPTPPPGYQQKSHNGLWIGLAVAAVLLCFGGGAGAVMMGGYLSGSATDGKSPTVPRTPVGELMTASPTPQATQKQVTITVAAPAKLGNRPQITDAEHTTTADQVIATLKGDRRVTTAIAAYYGTPDPKKDKVYLVAVTVSTPMSKSEFESTFAASTTQVGLEAMTDVADTEAGPLGGLARCGNLKIQETPVAACGWSDEGSFGVLMWYNRTVVQVKAQFIALRGEVEKA